jgi:hypothetical protein
VLLAAMESAGPLGHRAADGMGGTYIRMACATALQAGLAALARSAGIAGGTYA